MHLHQNLTFWLQTQHGFISFLSMSITVVKRKNVTQNKHRSNKFVDHDQRHVRTLKLLYSSWPNDQIVIGVPEIQKIRVSVAPEMVVQPTRPHIFRFVSKNKICVLIPAVPSPPTHFIMNCKRCQYPVLEKKAQYVETTCCQLYICMNVKLCRFDSILKSVQPFPNFIK